MKSRDPTRQEIDELTAFLPKLYADEEAQPGVSTWPWQDYNRLVVQFFTVAAKECWTDYEYSPDEASHLLNDPEGINNASIAQIKTMLTFCVRGERFSHGHWAAMITQDYIRRLLQRLCDLSVSNG